MTEEQPQGQEFQPQQPPQDPTMLFSIQGNPIGLFKGMAKFRAQVKQPKLDSSNPFFKSTYLSLTGLIKTIDEAIEGTGLSYLQVEANYGQLPGVQTIIAHESGGMLMTKPLIMQPAKMDPQGIGSATTYAKRYQLQALFGIAGEKDDDGNAASNPKPKSQQYRNNQQVNNRQNYSNNNRQQYNQYNGGNY